MTDQEITQARADLALLDIEQLRCGVMLQLLKIEALTKERDALAAVAKMALDALESLFGVPAEFTGVGGGAVAVWRLGGSDKPRKAITALRQAGVQ